MFSYLLISSNIIILYAIKLGADSFTIGLLSSFVQVAYIFMLIGRIFIKKTGAVKLMGTFWTIRYLMMIPVLFTPFLYNRGRADIALLVLIFSVLGFHTARGIAITSYNPIVGQLAGTKDRGVFLARIQIINHILVISVGIAIALLLGKNAPFSRYILFIATGITAGLIGCYFLFRLPEIKGSALGFAEKFTSSIFLSLKDSRFRQFIIVLFTASLALTTLLPFSILFFKRIYGNSDSQVIFFTVFGGLGALSMAILNGFMIDRIGSKPLILIYTLITSLVVIPIIIAPTFKTATLQFVFAGLVFFLSYMGTNGILNTSQNYFFALIKPQERLNLGILYFLTIGIAGVIG
ncbi:MAG: MFS transporter, partial [Spirochaetes bacterium]